MDNGRQQGVVRTGDCEAHTAPPRAAPAVGVEYVPSSAQLELQGLLGIFKCQQIFRLFKKKGVGGE